MTDYSVVTVRFNDLPRETRERFVECTNQRAAPLPIVCNQLGRGWAVVGWGVLLLLAVGGLRFLVTDDYGVAYDASGLQGAAYIPVYALAVFVGIYSLLAIIRRLCLLGCLPFVPGRYLFPLDFVVAVSSEP